jgi:hypothetical protein
MTGSVVSSYQTNSWNEAFCDTGWRWEMRESGFWISTGKSVSWLQEKEMVCIGDLIKIVRTVGHTWAVIHYHPLGNVFFWRKLKILMTANKQITLLLTDSRNIDNRNQKDQLDHAYRLKTRQFDSKLT